MKDHETMATENELIEQVQDGLGQIKKALREIQKINEADGRMQAANCAMGNRGKVIALHADMTRDLYEFYPEMAGGIQTRGGGGRGG